MEQLWQATVDEYEGRIHGFDQIPKWLTTDGHWAAVFNYNNTCLLFLVKRPGKRRDVVVHNILSRQQAQGYATAAILRLTIEASYAGYTICIENLMNPASYALARRLIRDYGFTNTPNNNDAFLLLMDMYLDTSRVYSPLELDKYLKRYYDYLYTGEEPPLKRMRY